jgi:hypothetical protein
MMHLIKTIFALICLAGIGVGMIWFSECYQETSCTVAKDGESTLISMVNSILKKVQSNPQ